ENDRVVPKESDVCNFRHDQIPREVELVRYRGNRVFMVFSLAIFSLLLMAICLFYIDFFKKEISKEESHLYLLALVAVVVLAVAKAVSLLNLELMEYLVPLSFAGIVLVFLSDAQLAWVVT